MSFTDSRNGSSDGRVPPTPIPRPTGPLADLPLPGQSVLVGGALAIGFLLLGLQLWVLTVALDLYLAGAGAEVWLLALVSGVIFLGGLVVLWVLRRRPHVRQPSGDEAPFSVGAWGNPPSGPAA